MFILFNRIEEDAASKHENEDDVDEELKDGAKNKEQTKEDEEKEKSAEDSPIKEQTETTASEPMETDESKPVEAIVLDADRPNSSGKIKLFSIVMH